MSEYRYDAFISYRHTEKDSFVAETLLRELERYNIPPAIKKKSGKKRINRIFRDKEELAAGAELEDTLTQALEQSEYLLLLCSHAAMESEWVQKELETFLKTHSRDNVIAVLVEGEPYEVYPTLLTQEQVEGENGEIEIRNYDPLGADLRGETKAEIRKKVKTEKLRILAAFLSCRYDELKQRQKEYRNKRIRAIVLSAVALVLGFLIFALVQNVRIMLQYQASQKNLQRYLVAEAGTLLDNGDRDTAVKVALALQNDYSEPMVDGQMALLNRAFGTYQYTDNGLIVSEKMEISNSIKSTSYDIESGMLLIIDDYDDAFLLNTRSDNEPAKIDLVAYGATQDSISEGVLVDDGTVFLVGDSRLWLLDYTKGVLVWECEMPDEQYHTRLIKQDTIGVGKEKFIISVDGYVICIDRKDGSRKIIDVESALRNTGLANASFYIVDMAYFETENKVFWSTVNYVQKENLTLEYSLVEIDITSGDVCIVPNFQCRSVSKIDSNIMLICESVASERLIVNDTVRLTTYDVSTGKVLYTSEEVHVGEEVSFGGEITDGKQVSYLNNYIYVVDLESAQKEYSAYMNSEIISLVKCVGKPDTMVAALKEGMVLELSVESGNLPEKLCSVDCGLSEFYQLDKNEYIGVVSNSVILFENKAGQQYLEVETNGSYYSNSHKLSNGESRQVLITGNIGGQEFSVKTLDGESLSVKHQFEIAENNIVGFDTVCKGDKIYVVATSTWFEDNQNHLIIDVYDGDSGEMINSFSAADLGRKEENELEALVEVLEDGRILIYYMEQQKIYIVDCLDNDKKLTVLDVPEDFGGRMLDRTEFAAVDSGKKLLMYFEQGENAVPGYYDLETGDIKLFEGLPEMKKAASCIFDSNQTEMAYISVDNKLTVYDITNQKTLMSYEMNEKKVESYSSTETIQFAADGNALIALIGNELISFDLKTGTVASSELLTSKGEKYLDVPGRSDYFVLIQLGYSVGSYNEARKLIIYKLDDSKAFSALAEIRANNGSGRISDDGKNILIAASERFYVGRIISFNDLVKKAEDLIGNLALTNEEKIKYNLAE